MTTLVAGITPKIYHKSRHKVFRNGCSWLLAFRLTINLWQISGGKARYQCGHSSRFSGFKLATSTHVLSIHKRYRYSYYTTSIDTNVTLVPIFVASSQLLARLCYLYIEDIGTLTILLVQILTWPQCPFQWLQVSYQHVCAIYTQNIQVLLLYYQYRY